MFKHSGGFQTARMFEVMCSKPAIDTVDMENFDEQFAAGNLVQP